MCVGGAEAGKGVEEDEGCEGTEWVQRGQGAEGGKEGEEGACIEGWCSAAGQDCVLGVGCVRVRRVIRACVMVTATAGQDGMQGHKLREGKQAR